jgi:transcriptional regulator with XRE-family HTH domain
MDKNKVGEFLTSKRNQLGISVSQMAQRAGCNRTTIQRLEGGTTMIRRPSIVRFAKAYEIGAQELAELCGYPPDVVNVDLDSQVTASVEDLEFLITVTRGLQKPMNIVTIRELLKCRQTK